MRVHLEDLRSKKKAIRAVKDICVDKVVTSSLAEKSRFFVFKIEEVSPPVATIIKQIAISRGTDAAVHRKVIVNGIDESNVLLPGSIRELKLIAKELLKQPFGLPQIGLEILRILKEEDKKRDYKIMGVLNITPDSFSDGGEYFSSRNARGRFDEIVKDGADIIDVGAESSRPNAEPVDEEEELHRLKGVLPLFSYSPIPVSIDTRKSRIAREALSSGAKILNDVSALKMDQEMVEIAKEFNATVVLMHMKGTPKTMQKNPYYDDVIGEIRDFFLERIEFCFSHDISHDKIILDPGIGFGKRQIDNLAILNNLEVFTSLGFPILIGTSRKSFIGNITRRPPKERLSGSLAALVYSYLRGARIFRVHDIQEAKDTLAVISNLEDV
ncbi:MAG: dihydropteroate synthase [Candidatus Stahlbacteria bacterium]|nr:MAG: dihydropteroate synthase [Candidatus Stahlbacteria bacterium]